MTKELASKEQIEELIDTLNSINISIREFCGLVASEEYHVTDAEVKQLTETYRKRFSRKSMTMFEFDLMLDVLEKQDKYKSLGKIRLTRKKNIFNDTDFEKSLRFSFKSL